MNMNFREYLKVIEEYALSSDYAGAAHDTTSGTAPYASPNIATGDSNAGEVPQHNIGLPQVTRRGKVVSLQYKAGGNVEIILDDRTIIKMSHGEFKRIGGDPVVPHRSTLTVVFQRNPGDQGQVVSQITKAVCEADPKVRMQSVNGMVTPPVQNSAS